MSDQSRRYPIIPKPVRLEPAPGFLAIDSETSIVAGPDVAREAEFLSRRFRSATGLRIAISSAETTSRQRINLVLDPEEVCEAEGYRLDVVSDRIEIAARTRSGLFYGIQTLLQLCPPAIFVDGGSAPSISVPCVHIEDGPRFGWRGLMLDVARHFMPLSFLKKMIDLAAILKFSRFHLHLVDDQGWRIEIKKYPKLTQIGAFRNKTMAGHLGGFWDNPCYDDMPHGGFYTQDELRDLVAYAAERHVEIIPEIEMPGHAQAAIAAYPELGNLDRRIDVCTHWGIIEHIFNPSEETIEFLQNVLVEVMEIFPSRFVHIGGDEAVKKEWETSDLAQRRIRELGLKDEHELQSWFIRRMDDFLTAHGRRLIGWDEILEGGLAANATVMSWRGEEGGIAAATSGHDVVMAPWSHTYFDHYQSRDRETEPLAQGGYLPLERVYEYNPIPADISPDAAHRVLGAQGQLWTEYMPTPERVEYMAFPRAIALAEAVWSRAGERDYDEFLSRLRVHLERLDAMGVAYRSL